MAQKQVDRAAAEAAELHKQKAQVAEALRRPPSAGDQQRRVQDAVIRRTDQAREAIGRLGMQSEMLKKLKPEKFAPKPEEQVAVPGAEKSGMRTLLQRSDEGIGKERFKLMPATGPPKIGEKRFQPVGAGAEKEAAAKPAETVPAAAPEKKAEAPKPAAVKAPSQLSTEAAAQMKAELEGMVSGLRKAMPSMSGDQRASAERVVEKASSALQELAKAEGRDDLKAAKEYSVVSALFFKAGYASLTAAAGDIEKRAGGLAPAGASVVKDAAAKVKDLAERARQEREAAEKSLQAGNAGGAAQRMMRASAMFAAAAAITQKADNLAEMKPDERAKQLEKEKSSIEAIHKAGKEGDRAAIVKVVAPQAAAEKKAPAEAAKAPAEEGKKAPAEEKKAPAEEEKKAPAAPAMDVNKAAQGYMKVDDYLRKTLGNAYDPAKKVQKAIKAATYYEKRGDSEKAQKWIKAAEREMRKAAAKAYQQKAKQESKNSWDVMAWARTGSQGEGIVRKEHMDLLGRGYDNVSKMYMRAADLMKSGKMKEALDLQGKASEAKSLLSSARNKYMQAAGVHSRFKYASNLRASLGYGDVEQLRKKAEGAGTGNWYARLAANVLVKQAAEHERQAVDLVAKTHAALQRVVPAEKGAAGLNINKDTQKAMAVLDGQSGRLQGESKKLDTPIAACSHFIQEAQKLRNMADQAEGKSADAARSLRTNAWRLEYFAAYAVEAPDQFMKAYRTNGALPGKEGDMSGLRDRIRDCYGRAWKSVALLAYGYAGTSHKLWGQFAEADAQRFGLALSAPPSAGRFGAHARDALRNVHDAQANAFRIAVEGKLLSSDAQLAGIDALSRVMGESSAKYAAAMKGDAAGVARHHAGAATAQRDYQDNFYKMYRQNLKLDLAADLVRGIVSLYPPMMATDILIDLATNFRQMSEGQILLKSAMLGMSFIFAAGSVSRAGRLMEKVGSGRLTAAGRAYKALEKEAETVVKQQLELAAKAEMAATARATGAAGKLNEARRALQAAEKTGDRAAAAQARATIKSTYKEAKNAALDAQRAKDALAAAKAAAPAEAATGLAAKAKAFVTGTPKAAPGAAEALAPGAAVLGKAEHAAGIGMLAAGGTELAIEIKHGGWNLETALGAVNNGTFAAIIVGGAILSRRGMRAAALAKGAPKEAPQPTVPGPEKAAIPKAEAPAPVAPVVKPPAVPSGAPAQQILKAAGKAAKSVSRAVDKEVKAEAKVKKEISEGLKADAQARAATTKPETKPTTPESIPGATRERAAAAGELKAAAPKEAPMMPERKVEVSREAIQKEKAPAASEAAQKAQKLAESRRESSRAPAENENRGAKAAGERDTVVDGYDNRVKRSTGKFATVHGDESVVQRYEAMGRDVIDHVKKTGKTQEVQVYSLDKSGLNAISRMDVHVADALNQQLMPKLLDRVRDILQTEGIIFKGKKYHAQHRVLGNGGCDERALVVTYKKGVPPEKVHAAVERAIAKAKKELMAPGGELDRMQVATETTVREAKVQIARERAAAEGKTLTDAEAAEAAKGVKDADALPRARKASLAAWMEGNAANPRDMAAAFTYDRSPHAIEVRKDGRLVGTEGGKKVLLEATPKNLGEQMRRGYEAAEEAANPHFKRVQDALGVKPAEKPLNEHNLGEKPDLPSATGAAKEDRVYLQVRLSLTAEGRARLTKALGEYVRDTAEAGGLAAIKRKHKLSDAALEDVRKAYREGGSSWKENKYHAAFENGAVEALRKEYKLSGKEAGDLIRMSREGALAWGAFAENVTRKGRLFVNDASFSETNTAGGHGFTDNVYQRVADSFREKIGRSLRPELEAESVGNGGYTVRKDKAGDPKALAKSVEGALNEKLKGTGFTAEVTAHEAPKGSTAADMQVKEFNRRYNANLTAAELENFEFLARVLDRGNKSALDRMIPPEVQRQPGMKAAIEAVRGMRDEKGNIVSPGDRSLRRARDLMDALGGHPEAAKAMLDFVKNNPDLKGRTVHTPTEMETALAGMPRKPTAKDYAKAALAGARARMLGAKVEAGMGLGTTFDMMYGAVKEAWTLRKAAQSPRSSLYEKTAAEVGRKLLDAEKGFSDQARAYAKANSIPITDAASLENVKKRLFAQASVAEQKAIGKGMSPEQARASLAPEHRAALELREAHATYQGARDIITDYHVSLAAENKAVAGRLGRRIEDLRAAGNLGPEQKRQISRLRNEQKAAEMRVAENMDAAKRHAKAGKEASDYKALGQLVDAKFNAELQRRGISLEREALAKPAPEARAAVAKPAPEARAEAAAAAAKAAPKPVAETTFEQLTRGAAGAKSFELAREQYSQYRAECSRAGVEPFSRAAEEKGIAKPDMDALYKKARRDGFPNTRKAFDALFRSAYFNDTIVRKYGLDATPESYARAKQIGFRGDEAVFRKAVREAAPPETKAPGAKTPEAKTPETKTPSAEAKSTQPAKAAPLENAEWAFKDSQQRWNMHLGDPHALASLAGRKPGAAARLTKTGRAMERTRKAAQEYLDNERAIAGAKKPDSELSRLREQHAREMDPNRKEKIGKDLGAREAELRKAEEGRAGLTRRLMDALADEALVQVRKGGQVEPLQSAAFDFRNSHRELTIQRRKAGLEKPQGLAEAAAGGLMRGEPGGTRKMWAGPGEIWDRLKAAKDAVREELALRRQAAKAEPQPVMERDLQRIRQNFANPALAEDVAALYRSMRAQGYRGALTDFVSASQALVAEHGAQGFRAAGANFGSVYNNYVGRAHERAAAFNRDVRQVSDALQARLKGQGEANCTRIAVDLVGSGLERAKIWDVIRASSSPEQVAAGLEALAPRRVVPAPAETARPAAQQAPLAGEKTRIAIITPEAEAGPAARDRAAVGGAFAQPEQAGAAKRISRSEQALRDKFAALENARGNKEGTPEQLLKAESDYRAAADALAVERPDQKPALVERDALRPLLEPEKTSPAKLKFTEVNAPMPAIEPFLPPRVDERTALIRRLARDLHRYETGISETPPAYRSEVTSIMRERAMRGSEKAGQATVELATKLVDSSGMAKPGSAAQMEATTGNIPGSSVLENRLPKGAEGRPVRVVSRVLESLGDAVAQRRLRLSDCPAEYRGVLGDIALEKMRGGKPEAVTDLVAKGARDVLAARAKAAQAKVPESKAPETKTPVKTPAEKQQPAQKVAEPSPAAAKLNTSAKSPGEFRRGDEMQLSAQDARHQMLPENNQRLLFRAETREQTIARYGKEQGELFLKAREKWVGKPVTINGVEYNVTLPEMATTLTGDHVKVFVGKGGRLQVLEVKSSAKPAEAAPKPAEAQKPAAAMAQERSAAPKPSGEAAPIPLPRELAGMAGREAFDAFVSRRIEKIGPGKRDAAIQRLNAAYEKEGLAGFMKELGVNVEGTVAKDLPSRLPALAEILFGARDAQGRRMDLESALGKRHPGAEITAIKLAEDGSRGGAWRVEFRDGEGRARTAYVKMENMQADVLAHVMHSAGGFPVPNVENKSFVRPGAKEGHYGIMGEFGPGMTGRDGRIGDYTVEHAAPMGGILKNAALRKFIFETPEGMRLLGNEIGRFARFEHQVGALDFNLENTYVALARAKDGSVHIRVGRIDMGAITAYHENAGIPDTAHLVSSYLEGLAYDAKKQGVLKGRSIPRELIPHIRNGWVEGGSALSGDAGAIQTMRDAIQNFGGTPVGHTWKKPLDAAKALGEFNRRLPSSKAGLEAEAEALVSGL